MRGDARAETRFHSLARVSRAWCGGPLRELPSQTIELIDSGRVTRGHGKALLTEHDHGRRRQLAHRAVDGGWSVRDLEAEIMCGAPAREASAAPHPDHVDAAATLADTISGALGIQPMIARCLMRRRNRGE